MADHNVEGHLQVLINVWSSPEWGDIWAEQPCEIESFERLGIPHDTPDTELWELCQQHEIVLVTGNRSNRECWQGGRVRKPHSHDKPDWIYL